MNSRRKKSQEDLSLQPKYQSENYLKLIEIEPKQNYQEDLQINFGKKIRAVGRENEY